VWRNLQKLLFSAEKKFVNENIEPSGIVSFAKMKIFSKSINYLIYMCPHSLARWDSNASSSYLLGVESLPKFFWKNTNLAGQL
jgi:hypothetical protein